jgi:hypothetical protein
MKIIALVLAALLLLSLLARGGFVGDEPVGYTDTPQLPGQEWRVHDRDRPVPPTVVPAAGANLGLAPPADATVLFDGGGTEAWHTGGEPIGWRVVDGALEVVGGTGNIATREQFGDCQLHLEWAVPASPKGEGQARGNSGVFLMGLYEVQVLDSYANATYADGQAAALYGQYPPLANASRPPGEWQSYDIVFRAPRFDGERLLSPAVITVVHNGVLVHHAREFLGATRHRDVASYAAHGAQGEIVLQDHGNPLRFRNLWVRATGR